MKSISKLRKEDELTVNDHIRFKNLLSENNPIASSIWDEFKQDNNKPKFENAVIQLLKALEKGKSINNKDDISISIKAPQSNRSTPCVYFNRSGNCRDGNACRFLHVNKNDIPEKATVQKSKGKKNENPNHNSMPKSSIARISAGKKDSEIDIDRMITSSIIIVKESPKRSGNSDANRKSETKSIANEINSRIEIETDSKIPIDITIKDSPNDYNMKHIQDETVKKESDLKITNPGKRILTALLKSKKNTLAVSNTENISNEQESFNLNKMENDKISENQLSIESNNIHLGHIELEKNQNAEVYNHVKQNVSTVSNSTQNWNFPQSNFEANQPASIPMENEKLFYRSSTTSEAQNPNIYQLGSELNHSNLFQPPELFNKNLTNHNEFLHMNSNYVGYDLFPNNPTTHRRELPSFDRTSIPYTTNSAHYGFTPNDPASGSRFSDNKEDQNFINSIIGTFNTDDISLLPSKTGEMSSRYSAVDVPFSSQQANQYRSQFYNENSYTNNLRDPTNFLSFGTAQALRPVKNAPNDVNLADALYSLSLNGTNGNSEFAPNEFQSNWSDYFSTPINLPIVAKECDGFIKPLPSTKDSSDADDKSKALLTLIRSRGLKVPPAPTHDTTDVAVAPSNLVAPVNSQSDIKEDEVNRVTDTPHKKSVSVLHRETKHQPGTLEIFTMQRDQTRHDQSSFRQNTGNKNWVDPNTYSEQKCLSDGQLFRPGGLMTIHWKLPILGFTDFSKNKEKSDGLELHDADYFIGLTRYGSSTNFPCIVTKPISIDRLSATQSFFKGKITFHAPKAAGYFVYRLFNNSSRELSYKTLATSVMFEVQLYDYDVTSNLAFLWAGFEDDGGYAKSISQLPSILQGISNMGKYARDAQPPHVILTMIIRLLLSKLHKAINILDEGINKKMEQKKRKLSFDETFDITNSDGDKLKTNNLDNKLTSDVEAQNTGFWISYRASLKIQNEIKEAFDALLKNHLCKKLLDTEVQLEVRRITSLYCPYLQRFFNDQAQMNRTRKIELGFLPLFIPIMESINTHNHPNIWRYLNNILRNKIQNELLPSEDFEVKREFTRQRIEIFLQNLLDSSSNHLFPNGTKIAVYGSSGNNFGGNGADVDMCILFPLHLQDGKNMIQDKKNIVEMLAIHLPTMGMTNISARATARIPIVQFTDPMNGLECDLSINNILAVRNTQLLRAYSEIDSRVRELAFIIKHWAKSRHLNSPSNGTLSSYGLVLLLIHFLQNRKEPLVPILQKLPPSWAGKPMERGDYILMDYLTKEAIKMWEEERQHVNSFHSHQDFKDEFDPNILSFSNLTASMIMKSMVKDHMVYNSTDNLYCHAYYYTADPILLKNFALINTESTAELFVEFFRYYATIFDAKQSYVSINRLSHHMETSKLGKAERDGWMQHDRFSIEDPFETWYDVAHVIKGQQMAYFRKEFLRAYNISCRVIFPNDPCNTFQVDESADIILCKDPILPNVINPEDFLSILCSPGEIPSFVREE